MTLALTIFGGNSRLIVVVHARSTLRGTSRDCRNLGVRKLPGWAPLGRSPDDQRSEYADTCLAFMLSLFMRIPGFRRFCDGLASKDHQLLLASWKVSLILTPRPSSSPRAAAMLATIRYSPRVKMTDPDSTRPEWLGDLAPTDAGCSIPSSWHSQAARLLKSVVA